MSGVSAATALILAAGKGTRMKSDLAKVLFPLEGRPLVQHVLDAVEGAGFDRAIAIVGHQHGRVREALSRRRVEFVLQEEQLGTGHAVAQAAPLLEGFEGDVVVLAGDAPLIRASTLSDLMRHHRDTGAAVTVLTAVLPDATGYGRMVRDAEGRITAIVEHRDCSGEQLRIHEINSSIYAFRWPYLARTLPLIGNENRQGEFYLTDTVGIAFREGLPVEGIVVEDHREVEGINTPEQLDDARAVMRERHHE